MKNLISIMNFPLLLILLFGFSETITSQPAKYVNPFIGTAEMGHTYPGATVPFGMVQLSPDTDTIPYSFGKGYNPDVYKYCAGYQYDDQTICGFSHTHFSGTGHSDLGDFLLMPTIGKIQLNPGTEKNPESGYRSRFSHVYERAEPGYYSVMLDDYKIKAELTATTSVGVHRYTPPEETSLNLILDMSSGIYNYPGKNTWQFVRVENDTLITGYRQTRGWARTRTIYFAMTLSKPIRDYGCENNEEVIYKGFYRKFDEKHAFPEMAGKALKIWFQTDASPHQPLTVKVALSSVSTAGAVNNLIEETGGKSFEAIRNEALQSWNNELSRITIKADSATMVNFYTSLYHAFLSPTIYEDVDGQYRGLDQNNYTSGGFQNYSTFSLWDTYRALHPLLTIVQQKRTSDIIQSMLAHRNQSVHQILPIWSHQANENWCMIGYHAVSVIADAMNKKIQGFDYNDALAAMKASAEYKPYDGIGDYMKYGYVPSDKNSNSASKTLEYAYDDWCIARAAEKTGVKNTAEIFYNRSKAYQHIFDSSIGFMRPKQSDGRFQVDFDPLKTEGQGFIEGNAWNYSLYVPQNPYFLIENQGGPKKFANHLDQLFEMQLDEHHIAESEDITVHGIIGNYIHGNEPSHHVPYLYSYAGFPYKTQQKVRQIMQQLYKPSVDGLPGNDDCGQMSAWYIFSALGFYPVCPGNNEYVFGSPSVSEAVIQLENGNSFTIKALNNSEQNIYIQKVRLKGKIYQQTYLTHETIMEGGELIFEMGKKPNKSAITNSNLPGK